MAIELDRVLETAGSRTKSIPKLIKNNHVYWQSRWDKTLLTQVLCAAFTSDMEVKGVSNLREAEELAEISALSVVSNHVSDGDHATRRKVIQRLGFRDFAEKCVYIGGLKMMERSHIRILVPAESMLLIPTPFDFDNLKGALKDIRELKDGGQLTKDEYDEYHQFLREYGEECMVLNQRAEKEREKYTKRGMITFLYPEATRSRNGLLQRAQRIVGDNYYPKEKGDMYIFPILGWGIEEVVRSDQSIKLGRTTLYTVFGKPFQVKELYEQDLSEIKLDKKPATPTDALMARLGKLAPYKVDPTLQEFYDTLARDYDPCIEAEFQTIPGIFEGAMSLPQKFKDGLSQIGLAVERMQRGD